MILACLAFLQSAPADDVRAQDVVRREYAIKAGVIGTLGRCVTWPAGSAPARGEPLKIGILGKDPFVENGANQLDRMVETENRKGFPIVVKRFDSAKDYEGCHILFVSNLAAEESTEKTVGDRLKAALELTRGADVMVVGESSDQARQGATACLTFDQVTNLIRLEVNPDAAARSRLKLAPDLLRLQLVKIVRD